MNDSIKLPISMSVDQVLELMQKSNGQIAFTINLVNNGSVSTEDNDFEDVAATVSDTESVEASTEEKPSWWSKVEKTKVNKQPRRHSKVDKYHKFRRHKLKISPVKGEGSRQAMWYCPLDNFPEYALPSEAKEALQACGLVTIRHVTALKESDIRHKLDKLGTYNEETCLWVIEQIKNALKYAGLKLFHPYGADDQEELDL